jgi:hypothetical protein
VCQYDFLGNIILAPISNTGLTWLSTIIYLILILTVLYAAYIGNRKIGLRFYSCTFYPIVKNETLMNGILYNVQIFNFCAVALVQLSVSVL